MSAGGIGRWTATTGGGWIGDGGPRRQPRVGGGRKGAAMTGRGAAAGDVVWWPAGRWPGGGATAGCASREGARRRAARAGGPLAGRGRGGGRCGPVAGGAPAGRGRGGGRRGLAAGGALAGRGRWLGWRPVVLAGGERRQDAAREVYGRAYRKFFRRL
ncbi:hypothetical protein GUJ93_ZPchr0013g34541 [Zizania palustris]|uniref:Uncharacterized protein n=1 Tax=Zizania palustris TaxID=103762 RepID=A0A8J5WY82_ZIZPA|nr:hypothetical protein GUJ93_ZPchr0013g34541 [Zizania palustris]